MPKYVIEREIPGAGKLSPAELRGVSQKSCGVLQKLGPQIQWVHSYVTDDRVYCVYIAPNEDLVREHARQGGFPANRISEVKEIIDPTFPNTASFTVSIICAMYWFATVKFRAYLRASDKIVANESVAKFWNSSTYR